MTRPLLCLLAVAACGNHARDAASGSATPTGSGSGAGSSAARPLSPKPPRPTAQPPTAEQRAAFKQHVKAGWAHQKQKEWAEAVTEFEAALAAIDGDQRALTELGFSAMAAGDFAKARRADEQAVQVAVDKKVKAAALYNLGQVAEKTNDNAAALRAYRASLALRPNKTVEQAIAQLGSTPTAAAPPFCAVGEEPCTCIGRVAFDVGPTDEVRCAPRSDPPSPVPGFPVFHIERDFHGEGWDYLLDEKHQFVAVIGGGFMYRQGAIMDDVMLDKAEIRTIAGHRVLRIETSDHLDEHGSDPDWPDMTVHKRVTVCVLGDAKTPTRCPLSDVPLSEQDATPNKDQKKPDTELELTITDDGTATLKLISGPSDEQIAALVGPHKLW